VHAPVVIAACGPWTPKLLARHGAALPVRAERAQIAFVERPAAHARGHCVLIDVIDPDLLYARQAADGTSLAGLHSRPRPLLPDPDALDPAMETGFGIAARDTLSRRMTAYAGMPVRRGHAGFYDMSPDGKAILDGVPGIEGAWLAAGFSGTGFKKSPAVGKCLAEWVVDGSPRTVDLQPFRLARFEEGKPILDEVSYSVGG
jgi:sarcosine oxidase subunit beta